MFAFKDSEDYIASLVDANIICVGNSLTYGVVGNETGKSYPTLISEIQAAIDLNWSVINNGINSDTGYNIANNFMLNNFPLIESGKKNIILIWEGTNDIYYGRSAVSAHNNYIRFCRQAKEYNADVFVLTTLPREEQTYYGLSIEEYNNRLDAFDTLVKTKWMTYSDGFIDIRSNPNCDEFVGVHPEEQPIYQVIANMCVRKILNTYKI